MNWKEDTGIDMLKRIVALLFVLADLAEQAAGRSRPVRWLVLWSLWQADAVAREFVIAFAPNAAGRCWSTASKPVHQGHDPADAMNLAVSLRSLALMVRNMAAQFHRLSLLGAGHCHGARLLHDLVQDLSEAFSPLKRPDTS